MIPKIIHYCWFGKGLMPKSQRDCIKSWKRLMPDYEIKRWDEKSFDFNRYSVSKYAYQAKKYALVSDVCRYNVLYEYGGIYLDTDVEVFKRFDEFLDAGFFSALEFYPQFFEDGIYLLDENGNPKEKGIEIPHLEILTSTIGCAPGNLLVGELRDYYNTIEANEEYATNYRDYVNNDRLVAKYATKYGFRYNDEKQFLSNNMIIYPTGIFGHVECVNPTYTVSYHHNAGSWYDGKSAYARMLEKLDKLGLLTLYMRYKAIKKTLIKKK